MIGQLTAGLSVVLAEAGPNNAPPGNPEWGKAAPTGLFVLLAFFVVAYFLFRSLNRHIKKVDTDFTGAAPAAETHLGESAARVPVIESIDTSSQTAPRLGRPDQMVASTGATRKEQIAKAKAARAARRSAAL